MHEKQNVKTILILGAGPLQMPAIAAGRRLGLRVVAADGDPKAPGLALADVPAVVNIIDPDVCLAVARREHVDGVIQICSEVSMAGVGLINETLGFAGPDRGAVRRATNKEAMRRAFEAGGAPSPLSRGAATEAEALAAATSIRGPRIVKPSRNSGSRGVSRLGEDAPDEEILAAYRRALAESRDQSTVIESFVEGAEFSVELLVWNGHSRVISVTDKVTTGAPSYVETGHSQPSRFTPAEIDRVVDAATRGIRALGLDWCAAHAEVKLGPTGAFIIEIGARLGGDFITTELVPRSTGIDMVAGAIRLALREAPDLTPRHEPRGAAIRYLQPQPGTVRTIERVDEARAMPGVAIVDLYVRPGDTVPPITSSLSRVGHVIAEGRDADEAVARAERARDAVRIATA